jgi:hypothetical protein
MKKLHEPMILNLQRPPNCFLGPHHLFQVNAMVGPAALIKVIDLSSDTSFQIRNRVRNVNTPEFSRTAPTTRSSVPNEFITIDETYPRRDGPSGGRSPRPCHVPGESGFGESEPAVSSHS